MRAMWGIVEWLIEWNDETGVGTRTRRNVMEQLVAHIIHEV